MTELNPTQIISAHLLRDVHYRYLVEVHNLSGDGARRGINARCKHALSVFPIAVAAWEAFINEKCLSKFSRKDNPTGIAWTASEGIERWSLEDKTLLLPHLIYGRTFSKDRKPYQDLSTLIKIRNYITHFRMDEAEPKYLKDLVQRNIVLDKADGKSLLPMPLRFETTEAMRWAHNVVSEMAIFFMKTIAPEAQFPFASDYNGARIMIDEASSGPLYYSITDQQARAQFEQRGMDPDAIVPLIASSSEKSISIRLPLV